MSHSAEKFFASDHPTAAGHFPGNPIIPGAVLLEEVLQAVGAEDGRPFTSLEILSAKFLRPVRPGDRMIIRWNTLASGDTQFECALSVGDQSVLTGTIRRGGKHR